MEREGRGRRGRGGDGEGGEEERGEGIEREGRGWRGRGGENVVKTRNMDGERESRRWTPRRLLERRPLRALLRAVHQQTGGLSHAAPAAGCLLLSRT